MKLKNDIRFFLNSFFEEKEQTKHLYKSFQKEIENKGFYIIKTESETVKIYTPEMVFILTSKDLPVKNMDTKKNKIINGFEYLKTFIEGYKEGEKYFETEYKVSANILYGENSEQYVKDIHLNFFHKHLGTNEGWVYVKKQYPLILTHKAINEHGYYSGIINKVEEQIKKYPQQFANFYKCEHNQPPQNIKNKTEQEQPKTFEELFYDTNFITPCIDILKQIEPPLIDTEYNYIGRLKGAFCVWIDEMQRQGIVKRFSDRKIFASLLTKKIKRFSIDESMFGKYQNKAENQYRTDIKTLLSQIKLSQNSQKGKLGI